jgi:integrase
LPDPVGPERLDGRAGEVLAFRRELEERLAPITARQVMVMLAGIFADAVTDGVLARSPCVDTVPRRQPRRRVVPLTADEVDALIAAAPPRYRALVVLGAACGLRLGEALGLPVGCVRLEERELDVVQQLVLVPGQPPRSPS